MHTLAVERFKLCLPVRRLRLLKALSHLRRWGLDRAMLATATFNPEKVECVVHNGVSIRSAVPEAVNADPPQSI